MGPGSSLSSGFHLLGAKCPLGDLVVQPCTAQMTKLTSRWVTHSQPVSAPMSLGAGALDSKARIPFQDSALLLDHSHATHDSSSCNMFLHVCDCTSGTQNISRARRAWH